MLKVAYKRGGKLTVTQISNAKIMDSGTSRNILTQLHTTANQFNLVTTMYYVSHIYSQSVTRATNLIPKDSIYNSGSSF